MSVWNPGCPRGHWGLDCHTWWVLWAQGAPRLDSSLLSWGIQGAFYKDRWQRQCEAKRVWCVHPSPNCHETCRLPHHPSPIPTSNCCLYAWYCSWRVKWIKSLIQNVLSLLRPALHLLIKRSILHQDISIDNILMYEETINGQTHIHGLLIDYDYAIILDAKHVVHASDHTVSEVDPAPWTYYWQNLGNCVIMTSSH